ncbi:hypothetical protein GCM10011585_12890 [Edaphobacter dinghuensis]|uniref:Uncharacterized protein n=1 Tax=Edaphobacter dinghuensis TaxID=1560005 RepID=A0A917H9S3_9BACT|nr:hypothetical protein GCM10011585_12890 [Edaphobacter dinghuensis]
MFDAESVEATVDETFALNKDRFSGAMITPWALSTLELSGDADSCELIFASADEVVKIKINTKKVKIFVI